ncbi:MAG: hypothetical protein WBA25_05780 [Jannaschia sp.]
MIESRPMTQPRIVHIERVRHDLLTGHVVGIAIRREADGVLTRCEVRADAEPTCTHAEATLRLRACADRI